MSQPTSDYRILFGWSTYTPVVAVIMHDNTQKTSGRELNNHFSRLRINTDSSLLLSGKLMRDRRRNAPSPVSWPIVWLRLNRAPASKRI